MEASFAPQPSQSMGQSPFFYYNPDPKPEHRQHGHFSPHPRGAPSGVQVQQVQQFQQHMHGLDPAMSLPSSALCPLSSTSPVQMQTQALYNQVHLHAGSVASPRPMCQKPTILVQDNASHLLGLDTDCINSDMYAFPSTPALSASGSAMGSPPSTCEILPTPVNGNVFFGLENLEGVKQGCEGEVQSENLAGGDWTSMGSPPMTPVFIHPPSLTASQASDLLATNACPSLSPSPSPLPRSSVSSVEFDFCDPRELTVASSSDITVQSLSADFPVLPTLCAGDDEEHKLMLGGEPFATKTTPELDAGAFTQNSSLTGPPIFDDFSDLDSEDDFVNGLVDFAPAENVQYLGSKRQRTEVESFDHENFLSEEELDDFEVQPTTSAAGLPSPPPTEASRRGSTNSCCDMKTKKRTQSRKAKQSGSESENSESDTKLARTKSATPYSTTARGSTAQDQQSPAPYKSSSTAPSQSGSSDNAIGSGSDAPAPAPAPVNRRGRKQSLTEDPSKTFVCDLCSRRFRRQEHLKRHYRSLHTQEKPFECNECGKKFSRSDNLSQHARTHGAGAIIMGVLEDGEMPDDDNDSMRESDPSALGVVLFEAAQAAVGSSTSSSGDSSSRRDSSSPGPSDDKDSRKKRKRDD